MTAISNEELLRPYQMHIDSLSYGKDAGIRELATQLTLDGIKANIEPFYMKDGASSAMAMDMAGDAGLGGNYAINNEQREEVDDLLFLTSSLPWTTEMSAKFAAVWFGVEYPAAG